MEIWKRQALTCALKDLCNLNRIKCAGKGFPAGGNNTSKGIEASKCQDIWDRASSLAGALPALCGS